jgi:hypothetical protein
VLLGNPMLASGDPTLVLKDLASDIAAKFFRKILMILFNPFPHLGITRFFQLDVIIRSSLRESAPLLLRWHAVLCH